MADILENAVAESIVENLEYSFEPFVTGSYVIAIGKAGEGDLKFCNFWHEHAVPCETLLHNFLSIKIQVPLFLGVFFVPVSRF